MIYLYTRKSLGSLCVFSRVRRKQACLPPESIKKSHLSQLHPQVEFPESNPKRLEIHHQITSFFKSASAPDTTSPSPLLLTLPFLPTSNSSRMFKYTSSTKPLFSAAAASSSRIPRIPGPAQGNVKKEFRRWMWRARYKRKEVLMLGGFGGGLLFGGGGCKTDLRSGEFDRFGRYLDGDEEFFLL